MKGSDRLVSFYAKRICVNLQPISFSYFGRYAGGGEEEEVEKDEADSLILSREKATL